MEHFDPTTDTGAVKSSCNAMLDVFDVALAFIRDNQLAWPDAANASERASKVSIGMIGQRGSNRAWNATRTAARRSEVHVRKRQAGRTDGERTMSGSYVDAMDATALLDFPTEGLELGSGLKLDPYDAG